MHAKQCQAESVHKVRFREKFVILAKAGIQCFQSFWIPRSSRRMTKPEFINRH